MDPSTLHKCSINNDVDANLDAHKMLLVFNAVNDGWTVRRNNENAYVFVKEHEGKTEIFEDSYLQCFLEKHLNLRGILQ